MEQLTINEVIKQFQSVFGDISYRAQKHGEDRVYEKGTIIPTEGMTEIIPVLQPRKKK